MITLFIKVGLLIPRCPPCAMQPGLQSFDYNFETGRCLTNYNVTSILSNNHAKKKNWVVFFILLKFQIVIDDLEVI